MTVSYSPDQVAQVFGLFITDVSTLNLQTTTALAGIYRFSFSTNIYFVSTLSLSLTLSSIGGSERFRVLLIKDPDELGVLANGVLLTTSVPSEYFVGTGIAETYTLADKTFTTAGTKTFDLDLAMVTELMTKQVYKAPNVAYYTTQSWNGSLCLWLVASQDSAGTWSAPVLSAYNAKDYANRDTGRLGAPVGSRVSRCPKTGLAISRQLMVKDGYTNQRVHPVAWDPDEPENPVFSDSPEPGDD